MKSMIKKLLQWRCRPATQWREADSLFVLSTGRVGTATLTELLALIKGVDAFHEPKPQLLAERKAARVEVRSAPEKYQAIFEKARSQQLLHAASRGQVYAETSARLTFFAPVLADMLPNARFVYLHRHPAGVVRSGMRRGWYAGHVHDCERIKPVEGEKAYANWHGWEPFQKICWYWDTYNRFILDALAEVNPNRWIELRSEELFDPSCSGMYRICELLRVRTPSRDDVEDVLARRHNSQETGEFPQYGQWDEAMRQILHEIAGGTMKRLGYKAGGAEL